MVPRRSGGSGFGSLPARPGDQRARERQALQLFQQNRLAEAEGVYRQLIAAGSRNAEVYLNLAAILWLTNRPQATIEPLRQAIALDPGNPEAHATLGTALLDTGDPEGAMAAFRRALEIRPGFVAAMVSLGNAHFTVGDTQAALRECERALRHDPHCGPAQASKAQALLVRGDYGAGWDAHEWRWSGQSSRSTPLESGKPSWQPGGGGRRLLLWPEQGLGDEIQFASMLPEAHQLAETVLVQADQRLLPILQRSMPELEFRNRAATVPTTDYDCQLAIGSLGRWLRRRESDFPRERAAYLKADPDRSQALRRQLSQPGKRLCGISWRSFSRRMQQKSIPLAQLVAALSRIADLNLVSLQYGPVEAELAACPLNPEQPIARVEEIDPVADIDGLAALIEACDLVVSVSNATAHLAGALGKPCWILTPQLLSDWRWMKGRRDCPWYPRATVLGQSDSGPWEAVLEVLIQELSNTSD